MDVTTEEVVDAKRIRFKAAELPALLRGIRSICSIRGKRVNRIDLTHASSRVDDLAMHMLGPTGNLRAPTLRIGSTLIVGFDSHVYGEFLR